MSGLYDEAKQWRDWLLRCAAGKPSQLQMLYGPAGERLLPEFAVDWLAGYEGSSPVRIGNEAHRQLQIDVYGEIMDVSRLAPGGHRGDEGQLGAAAGAPRLSRGCVAPARQRHLGGARPPATLHALEGHGLGRLRRAIRGVEMFQLEGPVDRWRELRDEIHAQVCEKGFDHDRGVFVQSYGSQKLDASLLMIPLVGFLPVDDPRCVRTIDAIAKELRVDGFVRRYLPDKRVDGQAGTEGAFLPCTFWLADCYALLGRRRQARALFKRLLALQNDVGLLSEEYDPQSKRLLGNFPQAFTHVSLINTAHNLTDSGPAVHRAHRSNRAKS